MTLASLQDRLATLVRQTEPISDQKQSLELAKAIATGNARMTPAEQVDVYREQFFLRHIGSLREDFPTIERLLGDEPFEAMCTAYLTAMPPTSFALRDASDRMTEFLERTAPYSGDALLRDCAAVEWAFIEAFDAADAPPLDVTIVSTIDEDAWDRVKLHF
ncbi:MAG: DNA-binding domain-containing protein, partial [Polyangiaceae bacterium]